MGGSGVGILAFHATGNGVGPRDQKLLEEEEDDGSKPKLQGHLLLEDDGTNPKEKNSKRLLLEDDDEGTKPGKGKSKRLLLEDDDEGTTPKKKNRLLLEDD